MTQMRMPALHFSGCGFLEALGCAFMCFQLWHKSSEFVVAKNLGVGVLKDHSSQPRYLKAPAAHSFPQSLL
jgi:hypothetical protein